ncbi:MAG: CrcB family protein [Flavobacteriales bacterium]|nr:CrcB family protein [Flavobacteriales bacterium]
MNPWIAVFLGGGAGSVVRFAISRGILSIATQTIFPWATLLSNMLATALLGWLVLRFGTAQLGREGWHVLLAIGFCGGFSTFSAFSWENYQLLRDGMIGLALANIVVSAGLGILVFYLLARTA